MRIRKGATLLSLLIAAVFAMTALHAYAQEGQMEKSSADKMEKPKEVTLKGEVLDLYCYMMHPDHGQGPDHAKCAMNCINKGLPVGFLADDEVYLIIGKDHESVADEVAEFAGSQSQIKGTLLVHHGVKAIELESIEKL